MAAISGSSVSPLAHQGFRQTIVSLEKEFINDVNKTGKCRYPRRLPVMATYKDTGSKLSRIHFKSKLVGDIENENKSPTLSSTPIIRASHDRGRLASIRRAEPEVVAMERKEFINDAVFAERQRTRYNDTLLPKYDASMDPNCSAYFSNPFIKVQLQQKKYREFPVTTWRLRPYTPLLPKELRAELTDVGTGVCRPIVFKESYNLANTKPPKRYGSVSDLDAIYRSKSPKTTKSQKLREAHSRASESKLYNTTLRAAHSYNDLYRFGRPNINKQSYRHLTIPTPPVEKLREREQSFINDAILSDKKRTKYKDLIPVYDARDDVHASSYHARLDVRKLVTVTRSLKPVGSRTEF